ncbi:hypothetical protein OBBRIDRAFT_588334 [Obba rivulosa]|uniref:Uncharacterized protein n=1 Tax=Obba rivulosa TaxID=1052685 RepID=A0A8E2ATB9_9APHY|nr:hypothetical protein OBBRIDRAFT_588334 [Obba rivulosa]
MAKRPGTSASRPYTSGRPSTSAGDSGYYDRNAQFTYSQDYSQEYSIDEEDEESEAEDVFAFGPPSTAEQQRQLEREQEQRRQHQLADLMLPYTPPGRPSEFAFPLASPALASPALASPALASPVTIPAPTFDPRAHDRGGPTAGPSTIYPRHPYPLSPAESPPSTDSQSQDDNPYRLRRLPPTASSALAGSPPMTAATGLSGVSSAISSREVHVSLAAVAEKMDEEAGGTKGKARRALTPESSSFPSVLDDMDSRDGSIK